jgi:hypothetical protein
MAIYHALADKDGVPLPIAGNRYHSLHATTRAFDKLRERTHPDTVVTVVHVQTRICQVRNGYSSCGNQRDRITRAK